MRKVFGFIWRLITAPFRFITWLFRSIRDFFKKLVKSTTDFFTEDPEDTPLAEVLETGFENPTAILYHINELRKHLFRALIGFLITTVLAFVFIADILDWVSGPKTC